jgi:hypothetical protein
VFLISTFASHLPLIDLKAVMLLFRPTLVKNSVLITVVLRVSFAATALFVPYKIVANDIGVEVKLSPIVEQYHGHKIFVCSYLI